MKYGVFALLAIALLPACGCLRKDSEKKVKKEKVHKKMARDVVAEQMPAKPDMMPEIVEIDMIQENMPQ